MLLSLVPTECQVGSEDSPAACQDHHLLTTSCPLSPWSSNPPSQEANLLVHFLLNQPKQEPTVFERSARLNFGGEEEEIWLRRGREEICWRRKRHFAEKEKKVAGEGKQIWRKLEEGEETRSSWLNCALRGDEPVCWVRIGQQGLVLGGTESIKGGTG